MSIVAVHVPSVGVAGWPPTVEGLHVADRGFANYTFNELCSFGPGTANIFRRMVGLQEATWSKEEENKKEEEEDDKSYLDSSSIQDPKQSIISDFTT